MAECESGARLLGPFLLGVVLADAAIFGDAVRQRLCDFATVFFLPIYFTYTGLRVDVSLFADGDARKRHGLR